MADKEARKPTATIAGDVSDEDLARIREIFSEDSSIRTTGSSK